MSEPLSSVEIEDVLSSIRRLVSEDLRPVPRGVPALGGEKLLLTPALRVVSEAPVVAQPEAVVELEVVAEPEAAFEPVAEAPMVEVEDEPDAVSSIEQVVATVSAAVAAQPQEWESETGDASPSAEWEDQVWDDPEPVVVDDAPTEDVSSEPPAPEVVEVWAQEDSGEAFVFQHQEVAPPPAADPDWVDEAEAEVIAGLREPSPAATTFDPDDDLAEMTFDEEVLRDLVRDLIREELQGTLGERITRNIRKLVRAEVARALAMQEFD
ncbi:MAG: hypothetical protein ACRC14_17940 [Paracoccaceae bacterium]